MGLSGPPPTPPPRSGPKFLQKGILGGDLGRFGTPECPFFSLCWPHFGSKMAFFGPAGGIFEANLANLLASGAPFWAVTSTFSNTASLRVGGRQLWVAAVDFSLESGPFCRFGTHDRPSSTSLVIWAGRELRFAFLAATGPFFNNTDTNLPAKHT